MRSKFGVEASQLQDLLALSGDTSDNVPGAPGVGVKTAAKWLNAFSDLGAVLRYAKQVPLKGETTLMTARLRESLLANEATVHLAREIVGFRTDMRLGLTWNALRFMPVIEPEVFEPSPTI